MAARLKFPATAAGPLRSSGVLAHNGAASMLVALSFSVGPWSKETLESALSGAGLSDICRTVPSRWPPTVRATSWARPLCYPCQFPQAPLSSVLLLSLTW